MNAQVSAPAHPLAAPLVPTRSAGIGLLRAIMLGEAALTLALAIGLSVMAGSVGADGGAGAEENLRFVAGFSFVFAILAAVASRGARRRRPWAWTLAALLQLVLAIATGIGILVATWHPIYLLGFAFAATVMLALSAGPVRRGLGQD